MVDRSKHIEYLSCILFIIKSERVIILSKCINCGNDIANGAAHCPVCGAPAESNRCPGCRRELSGSESFCPGCGAPLRAGAGGQNANAAQNARPVNHTAPKSRLVAGLLGVFLGSLGVHSFYLGHTGRGVAQILVSVFTCGIGGIWGFIEGILILCRNINVDASGMPLKEDC